MNAGWHICLSIISVGVVHKGEIENKVPNLTVELILIDVPLITIPTRNIDVSVY
jgi:hypothetical protein